MPRIKNPKQVILNITDIGHKGTAIGKTEEGMVAFVRNAVPGDKISALLYKKSKGVWQGKVLDILEPSVYRTNSFCSYFGNCGGCSWQDFAYQEQANQKQKQVLDAVKRIAGMEADVFEPILKAPQTEWYRNKLEFTFSNHKWLTQEEMATKEQQLSSKALGFHRPESFNKVIDIDTCYLQNDKSNQIKNFIREYTSNQDWTYYDIKTHQGLLRNMIVRTNLNHQIMLVLAVSDRDDEKLPNLFKEIKLRFPEIISCYVAENKSLNDSWAPLTCYKIFGEDYLTESLEHVNFNIGPKSFFQTNTRQAVALYQTVREYASLEANQTIYDLYCGVGSIGLFLANSAAKVVGIEEIEAAIEDAKVNAEINKIENAHFVNGDVRKVLTKEFAEEHGHPDVMIVDPPRNGLHPDVCQTILDFQPERIVYVSCNPATLARDLKILSEKYQLLKLKPVDMFPHTSHIEAVSLLELKKL